MEKKSVTIVWQLGNYSRYKITIPLMHYLIHLAFNTKHDLGCTLVKTSEFFVYWAKPSRAINRNEWNPYDVWNYKIIKKFEQAVRRELPEHLPLRAIADHAILSQFILVI